MDPTSILLFTGDSKSKNPYQSNRYTTRPTGSESPKKSIKSKEKPPGQGLGGESQKSEAKNPNLSKRPKEKPNGAGTLEEQNLTSEKPLKTTVNSGPKQSYAGEVTDFFLGGSYESVGEYKRQLNPKDIRRNFIEIGVAPIYMYVDSSSQFWLRSFWSQGPGILGEATLWLSPFLGIKGSFSTSLGTTIRGNPQMTENLLADHQVLNAGIRFRRFFGYSRRAAYFVFGLDYFEYKMSLPPDANFRVDLETGGVQFSLQAVLPTSHTHSWDIGVGFVPRANTTENSEGVATRSGHHPESYSFGVWFGGQFNWNRTQRYFWKISHRVDKSVYEGETNQADPITGEVYKGVDVTLGMSQFQMGYRWGN